MNIKYYRVRLQSQLPSSSAQDGDLYFVRETGKFYLWDADNSSMRQIGGSASVVWGAITGTLSDQTDLQTALDDLTTAITNESNTRASADSTLSSAISSEASTRATADTTNANAISAETSRAESAEAALVPNTRTVNGKPLSSDVTLSTSDVAEGSNLYYTNVRASAAAPVQSVAGKTGTVTLAESDIANLTTDLAAKAPLASPALTGSPTAPTQSALDNSTKLATTAYADAAVAVEASARATAVSAKQDKLTGTGLARNNGACSELSGDVTTSGSNATTLKATGSAGTYTKVTTDAAGRVSSGTTLAAGDIPDISATYEVKSNKDSASGYAGLDSNGNLKLSEFPDIAGGNSGQAWLWGGAGMQDIASGSAATISGGNPNRISGMMMMVPFAITIRKVSMTLLISSGSGTVYAGIYSADGNTKYVEAQFSPSGASAAFYTVTLNTPVTLKPGVYFAVCASSSGSVTSPTIAIPNTNTTAGSTVAPSLSLNATRAFSQAGNNTSGGSLPSSLGALTKASTTSVPAVLYEG